MAIKRSATNNRAAATKKDDLPIFLKKTFHLINTCDPNIASWSDDGKLFIVKDPELFASDVIPQFFRHNNFASFVRQLNFYGFKKIKNDDSIHVSHDNPNWWKFKHENFLRGRPDLLPLIKKAHQINAVNKEEVDKLREEVGQLKDMVHMMAAQLQQLTGYEVNVNTTGSSNKKRKLEEEVPALPAPQPDVTSSYSSMPPLPALPNMQQQQYEQPDPQLKLSLLDPMVSDQDLLVDDWNVDTGVLLERGLERIKSADIVESMFDFVNEDYENEGGINDVAPPVDPALLDKDFQPDTINSFNRSVSYHSQGEEEAPSQLDPKLTAKLNLSIAKLPKTLQQSFVERMAEQIASPEAYQKHVNAVEVLANAAAIQAQNQTNEQKDNVQGDKLSTAALGAAALGAFLTKYQDGEAAYEPE